MQDRETPRRLLFPPIGRPVVYFGPFRLDLSDGQLTRAGEEIRLPPRALAILLHLVSRPGRVASKQALMDAAWKDAHVSETSLTEAVGLIRQALGDDPQKPEFIQTVHRRGYRFIAPVGTDAPSPALPPVKRSEPREHRTAGPAPDGAAATRRTATMLPLVGGALVTLAALGVWIASRPAPAGHVLRVNVAFPAEQAPVPRANAHPIVTLSPDGRRFVYVAGAPDSARLFLREMNRFDAVPLPGTERAHGPFFSPDGAWVAFFADGKLKKVRARENDPAAPQVICDTEPGVGGAWVSADEIVFAANWSGPLLRVPASG